MLEESIIKKILFSRYLYALAEENINTGNPVKLSTGVILLQDSVEIFLVALAEHVNASIDASTSFNKCIEQINKKITPKELPYKTKLVSLNKLRVNTKHYGIQPEPEECKHLLISVIDFYEEVSLNHLGKSFGSISLIDLLDEGEVKDILKEAIDFYENGKYEDCLINCRKAIFLEIEKDYSIEDFKDISTTSGRGLPPFSKSPYFTLNSKYIEMKVKNPTDYIVYDHDALEMELMQYGIEHNDFWNVWRLTPKVFRSEKDKEWVVKYEFAKFDKDTIKTNAEYVLNKTIDIILKIQKKRQAVKTPPSRRYHLELKSEEVKVFEKADKNSHVVTLTPKGIRKIDYDFRIKGLNDNDFYRHVIDISFSGYIHEDDIV